MKVHESTELKKFDKNVASKFAGASPQSTSNARC